jgi:hypothetical protein
LGDGGYGRVSGLLARATNHERSESGGGEDEPKASKGASHEPEASSERMINRRGAGECGKGEELEAIASSWSKGCSVSYCKEATQECRVGKKGYSLSPSFGGTELIQTHLTPTTTLTPPSFIHPLAILSLPAGIVADKNTFWT